MVTLAFHLFSFFPSFPSFLACMLHYRATEDPKQPPVEIVYVGGGKQPLLEGKQQGIYSYFGVAGNL